MAMSNFTDDELRTAFRNCRRDTWPENFEEAMNDPFFARLVRLHAFQRAKRIEERAKQAHHQQRPARKALPVPSTQPVFDHKRLAAGEREDD